MTKRVRASGAGMAGLMAATWKGVDASPSAALTGCQTGDRLTKDAASQNANLITRRPFPAIRTSSTCIALDPPFDAGR